jgi:hypothetical protein
MGGRFGRKKKNQFDPNLPPYYDPYYPSGPQGGYGMPPPYPYGAGYNPYERYDEYDPMDIYGYGYPPTESMETYYGGPMRRGPYGGRYARGKVSKIEIKIFIRKFICRI